MEGSALWRGSWHPGLGSYRGAGLFPAGDSQAFHRPVERIVIQKEPYEVIKYVDRVIEKRIEVPVEKVVERRVDVPMEKIVEKRVEVPVDRIVYRDRIVEKPVPSVPAGLSSWRQITKGLSREEVRSILGEPLKIEGGAIERWYYGSTFSSYAPARVDFMFSGVYGWSEP